MRYEILDSHSPDTLANNVSEYMRAGFVPHGSLILRKDETEWYYLQVMVRYDGQTKATD